MHYNYQSEEDLKRIYDKVMGDKDGDYIIGMWILDWRRDEEEKIGKEDRKTPANPTLYNRFISI